MTLFEIENYRDIIREKIQSNSGTRGYQTQLAKFAGCQASYFSQVLKGQVHLTPDQAAALCEFWHLTDLESEYFLTLVNYERAGTHSLQQRLSAQLERIREESRRVASLVEAKLKESVQLDPRDALYYWVHWYCPAIHGALVIPTLRTIPTLAEYFSLPAKLVTQVLERLAAMKIARFTGDEWVATGQDIFMHDDETLIRSFHGAMRQRANFKLAMDKRNELHYTWIDSISKKDMPRIKALFHETIKTQLAASPSSEPDELVCFCFDFFAL